jgi:hypothetical protein
MVESPAATLKVAEYVKKSKVYVGTVVTGCYGSRLHHGQVARINPPEEGTDAFDQGKVNVYVWEHGIPSLQTTFFPSEYVWRADYFVPELRRRLLAPEALQKALRDYDVVTVTSAYTSRWAVLRAKEGRVTYVDDPNTPVVEDIGPSLSHRLNAWLLTGPVVLGDQLLREINQANRECVVVEVKKLRYRIEYEMPGGPQQGWRTGCRVAGRLFYAAGLRAG